MRTANHYADQLHKRDPNHEQAQMFADPNLKEAVITIAKRLSEMPAKPKVQPRPAPAEQPQYVQQQSEA